MSKKNHDALVALKVDLRTNVKMSLLLDMLEVPAGGFMNKAEAVIVRAKVGDFEQMGELIEILKGKGDAQFMTFCIMLTNSGHQEWANKLKSKAGIFNPGEGILITIQFRGFYRFLYPCRHFSCAYHFVKGYIYVYTMSCTIILCSSNTVHNLIPLSKTFQHQPSLNIK